MRSRTRGAGTYMTAAAIISWFGLMLQCFLSLSRSAAEGQTIVDGLVMFFGYFTILTNLLVCAALTIPLITPASAMGSLLTGPFAVGGIAASIAFVSLAYHVLLRSLWDPHGVHLIADTLLHYAVPALFAVYWFVFVRIGTLRFLDAVLWGIYPIAYFVYVLIRGKIIGSYPYGFIDVDAIGFRQTMVNAVGLLLVFIVVGSLFVGIDRLSKRWTPVVDGG